MRGALERALVRSHVHFDYSVVGGRLDFLCGALFVPGVQCWPMVYLVILRYNLALWEQPVRAICGLGEKLAGPLAVEPRFFLIVRPKDREDLVVLCAIVGVRGVHCLFIGLASRLPRSRKPRKSDVKWVQDPVFVPLLTIHICGLENC